MGSFFSSCNTSTDAKVDNILQIDSENLLYGSECPVNYKFSRILSFDTSIPDGVIKNINRMLLTDNRIYVIDHGANKVIMYDADGKYINSTSKYIGKASNEYVRICDITTDGKHIYASCDAPKKIMVFDMNLNYISSHEIEKFLIEIATDGKFLYGIRFANDYTLQEVVTYPLNSLADSPATLLAHDLTIKTRTQPGQCMLANGDEVIVSLPFENSLYILKNGKIKQRNKLDFGNTGLSNNPIPNNMEPRDFDIAYKNINWCAYDFVINDSLFLFNTNLSPIFAVNRNTKIGGRITMMSNDLPFSSANIISCSGGGAEVYVLLYDFILDHYMKNVYDKAKHTPALELLKEKYDAGDSPILVVWRIE